MTDVMKRPFAEMMRETVLAAAGHDATARTSSRCRPSAIAHAARAHDRSGAARDVKWHVYPELAAAGLWTTLA